MKFERPLNTVKEKTYENPPPGKYICRVKEAELSKSQSGNDMVVLFLDIIQGKWTGRFDRFPLRSYHPYSTDEQLQRLKTVLRSFQKSNVSITEDMLQADTFNEEKLIGCDIGVEIGINERGYPTASWLMSVDRAKGTLPVITSAEQAVNQALDGYKKSEPDEFDVPF